MSFYNSIKQRFDKEEDQIDPVQNRECFKRAIEGSEEDVQEFITNNMRLVSVMIIRFRQRYFTCEYLEDDMFAEGLLALTRAVRTLVKYLSEDKEKFQHGLASFTSEVNMTKFNVIMYIYVSIYRAVQRLYELDSSDPISERIRNQHTPKGAEHPTRKVNFGDDFFESIPCDTFQETYLLETILDACQTDDEYFIIGKRYEGFLDREIARELNCDRSYVTHVKNRVYKRFCNEHFIGLRSHPDDQENLAGS